MRRVTLHETEVGLLYVKGRYRRTLGAGRHWIWPLGSSVTRVDARRRIMVVPSQEILTKDNVQLRLSAVLTVQLTDPVRALHDTQSWEQELHVSTQLALRSVVGELSSDDLLEGRLAIADSLRPLIEPRAEAVGVALHEVDLRDVILPGEVRQAFAEVLRARAEGRAALERARGESAALRNLANAARVVDGNPALMKLRILQAISQEAPIPGTTRWVVNLSDGEVGEASEG